MATKTTSDLPKSVKVAWRDYKIENWDRREAAGAGRYGETVHASKTIKIDMSYGSRQAASTPAPRCGITRRAAKKKRS